MTRLTPRNQDSESRFQANGDSVLRGGNAKGRNVGPGVGPTKGWRGLDSEMIGGGLGLRMLICSPLADPGFYRCECGGFSMLVGLR